MSVAPIRQLKQNYGGVEVSYYDGSTLLGTQKVPKGKDALHPSITVPTKSGYTFVGWATSNSEGDWVNTLTADEPMSLYAIYATSSKTVVAGTVSGGTSPAYSNSLENTDYVTGSVGGDANIWYNPGTVYNSFTFALDKKFYATASVVIGQAQHNEGSSSFDGVGFSSGYSATINNGSHTIAVSATNDAEPGHGWAINAAGVTALTLSNPTAWT